MKDLGCVLAGLTRLFLPAALVVLWSKKAETKIHPAIAAFLACFPIFIIASAIRSGFSREDMIGFYVRQGILFGIFEEGGKFLMLRYILTSCKSRNDAVTYGIGHSAYELFGSGLSCFGLIGTGNAMSAIFPVAIFSVIEGALWTVGLTVIIFYGIDTGKSRITLPAAMLLHALCNMTHGILIESAAFDVNLLFYAVIFVCAYICWKKMGEDGNEYL